LLTGKLTHESEGAKGYVFVTIAIGVAVVVLWIQWLNAEMGGGGKRPVSPYLRTATPVHGTGRQEGQRATPYILGGMHNTNTPIPTPSPVGLSSNLALTEFPSPVPRLPVVTVLPTATFTPSPTLTFTPVPTGQPVFVVLSSYWPDEGPDWCLTWDESEERCISPLTSGDDFRVLDGQALACDPAWLGQTIVIPALSLSLPCLDTGASFTCGRDSCSVGWLDSSGRLRGEIYAAVLFAR
jgi:hypothetical protein